MNDLQKIMALSNKPGNEEQLFQIFYVLMKTFGWTYYDLIGEEITEEKEIKIFNWKVGSIKKTIKRPALPIPVILAMFEMIKKETDYQKNQMRKTKK